MKRLIQISDPHIVVPPALVSGRLDTAALLERAVERIEDVLTKVGPVTALLVTGDVTDSGDAASYALFRQIVKPLGLPIPHTAIIPRKKDQLGETLAQFLKENFLVPQVIARRMASLDVAGALAHFLVHRAGSAGRMRYGASRLFGDVIEALDPERMGGMVRAGDILLEIDPTDAQSRLDIARTDRAEAEAEQRDAIGALTLAQDTLAGAQAQADLRARALTRQRDLAERGVGAVEVADHISCVFEDLAEGLGPGILDPFFHFVHG